MADSPIHNAQTTLGALEIGLFIALFLFGIASAQTSIYYQRFPKDPSHLKTLVGVVWLLEVAHTILISCLVYTLTISYYGHAEQIVKFTCLNVLILFGSGITWIEQVYFSFRIWKIMNRSFLGFLCMALSSARFLACVALVVGAFKEPTFALFAEVYAWLLTTVLVGSACVDIIIAISLCYFLRNQRDHSFGSTTKILDRLIAWTLQTGLVTSITATFMVICFKTMPENYIWLAIYMFLGKMYSNSLLASLNNRIKLRAAMGRMSTVRISGLGRTEMANPSGPQPLPGSMEMSTTTGKSSFGTVEKHIYEEPIS